MDEIIGRLLASRSEGFPVLSVYLDTRVTGGLRNGRWRPYPSFLRHRVKELDTEVAAHGPSREAFECPELSCRGGLAATLRYH